MMCMGSGKSKDLPLRLRSRSLTMYIMLIKTDSFVMKESCDTSQAYPAIVVIATQTPSGYRVKQ